MSGVSVPGTRSAEPNALTQLSTSCWTKRLKKAYVVCTCEFAGFSASVKCSSQKTIKTRMQSSAVFSLRFWCHLPIRASNFRINSPGFPLTKKKNDASIVLATCLSNQMMSLRHNRTWHYGVVIVQQKWSLFHQDYHLISRISYSRDNYQSDYLLLFRHYQFNYLLKSCQILVCGSSKHVSNCDIIGWIEIRIKLKTIYSFSSISWITCKQQCLWVFLLTLVTCSSVLIVIELINWQSPVDRS